MPGIAFRPFAAARSPGARSLLAVGLLVLLPCLAVPAAADAPPRPHVVLPPDVDQAEWAGPLSMTGVLTGRPEEGPWVEVVAGAPDWSLVVRDAGGVLLQGLCRAPVTEEDRRGLLIKVRSILRPERGWETDPAPPDVPAEEGDPGGEDAAPAVDEAAAARLDARQPGVALNVSALVHYRPPRQVLPRARLELGIHEDLAWGAAVVVSTPWSSPTVADNEIPVGISWDLGLAGWAVLSRRAPLALAADVGLSLRRYQLDPYRDADLETVVVPTAGVGLRIPLDLFQRAGTTGRLEFRVGAVVDLAPQRFVRHGWGPGGELVEEGSEQLVPLVVAAGIALSLLGPQATVADLRNSGSGGDHPDSLPALRR